jgi:hypothetical protein
MGGIPDIRMRDRREMPIHHPMRPTRAPGGRCQNTFAGVPCNLLPRKWIYGFGMRRWRFENASPRSRKCPARSDDRKAPPWTRRARSAPPNRSETLISARRVVPWRESWGQLRPVSHRRRPDRLVESETRSILCSCSERLTSIRTERHRHLIPS